MSYISLIYHTKFSKNSTSVQRSQLDCWTAKRKSQHTSSHSRLAVTS